MRQVTYAQLKAIAPTLKAPPKDESKPYQVTPMFLPTDISAKKNTGVLKVVTRQSFMDTSITNWVLYNSTRAAAIILGAAALILLSVNWIFAAIAGLAAGYFYGKHKYYSFFAIVQPRHRWLLEGT